MNELTKSPNQKISSKYRMRLDKNLRFLLKKNSTNIATICRKLNLSPKTIYAYTYGVAPKNIESIQLIADYFGTTLSSLLFENLEVTGSYFKDKEIQNVSIEVAFLVKHEKNGEIIKEERKIVLQK